MSPESPKAAKSKTTSKSNAKKPAASKNTEAAADDARDENPSPEELRDEIDETRGDLGDTVAALAEKTDVKAQAKKKAAETKQQAKAKAEEAAQAAKEKVSQAPEAVQQNPAQAVIAVVATLLLIAWLIRRRG